MDMAPAKFASDELDRARLHIGWLAYDAETGVFTWIKSLNAKAKVGAVAGTVTHEGYRRIRLHGRTMCAHRLAWFFTHGELPEAEIDHVDGNRDNNAIKNLRACLPHENHQNRTVMATNKTGYLGVSAVKNTKKYLATIMTEGRTYRLGHFDDPHTAAQAYANAKASLHTFNPTVRKP